MTDCKAQLSLRLNPRLRVDVTFDAPRTSSDGGLLLLRQVDSQLGLCDSLGALLHDGRYGGRVEHSKTELLRQRVLCIAMGYEDCNDASTMRRDPLLKLACGRPPETSKDLSSQPTLSRFENAVTPKEVKALTLALERHYVEQLPADTRSIVLDIDPTDDPTHGQQQLSFYRGFYNTHMYFPILVFDGSGQLVTAMLRPGSCGTTRGACGILKRIICSIRGRFPDCHILIRGDGGFAVPVLMDMLEDLNVSQCRGRVDYLFGIAKNATLIRLAAKAMSQAAQLSVNEVNAVRVFDSFEYKASSWRAPRTVVAKAEHSSLGANPRFLVTSTQVEDPRFTYEHLYCQRGQAENYIKEFKNALSADRLSCSNYWANAFRLILHACAYRLMFALRRNIAMIVPDLGRCQFDTIRLRLLKVASLVTQSVRRILVRLPSCFPLADVFHRVSLSLIPAPA